MQQVIAWSGAGLATYSNAEALVAETPTVPVSIAEGIYPQDIQLFDRQVAGDNSSITSDNSSWIPQVSSFFDPPVSTYLQMNAHSGTGVHEFVHDHG